VLIVRGAGNDASNPSGTGRDWFADKVLAAGGSVDFVIAYQRRVPEFTEIQMEMVRQAAVDGAIWLFSSSEAIENLVALLPEQSWSRARAVVTHPRIARTAENAGFAVVCESRPVLADLLASIESMQ
jgi:uroporphyrinogen-III synthase